MICSEAVRTVRKKAQLERLDAKAGATGNEYAEYFANLPQQRVAAQVNEQIRADREDVKDKVEALQIAEITGEKLLKSQEELQIALLVLQKHEDAKNTPSSPTLTAGG